MSDFPALGADFSFQYYADSVFVNESVSTVADPEETNKPRLAECYPQVFPLVRRVLWYLRATLVNDVPAFLVWRAEGRTEELKNFLLSEEKLLEIFMLVPFDAVDSSFVKSFVECSLFRVVENLDLHMVAVWISEALVHYLID